MNRLFTIHDLTIAANPLDDILKTSSGTTSVGSENSIHWIRDRQRIRT